jgi:hypothetical protein
MSQTLWLFSALIVVQIVHLIEEIKTGFRVQFPLGEMPVPVFIGVNALFYLASFITLYLMATNNPSAAGWARVIGWVLVANGVLHLLIMAVRGAYFPGGWTALPVLLLAAWLLVRLGGS